MQIIKIYVTEEVVFERVKNVDFLLFVYRTSKEILRLTRENYDELIVDAQLRSMTLVLLVEENSKDELLRDFKLMTSPTERFSLFSVLVLEDVEHHLTCCPSLGI